MQNVIKEGSKFKHKTSGVTFIICKMSDKSVWTEDPNRPNAGPWRESINTFKKRLQENLIHQPALYDIEIAKESEYER